MLMKFYYKTSNREEKPLIGKSLGLLRKNLHEGQRKRTSVIGAVGRIFLLRKVQNSRKIKEKSGPMKKERGKKRIQERAKETIRDFQERHGPSGFTFPPCKDILDGKTNGEARETKFWRGTSNAQHKEKALNQ